MGNSIKFGVESALKKADKYCVLTSSTASSVELRGRSEMAAPAYFMGPLPRAYVFIDGFNLFYRCLSRSSRKWLNIQSLFEQMLPFYEIKRVKYFTAMIRSRGDPAKSLRQETYLRALRTLPKVEIYQGLFSNHKVCRELAKSSLLKRIKRKFGIKVPTMNKCVWVFDPKEKASDVNLAVHMVNDAWKNLYDVAVVVSNDSDLIEALKIVRGDCKKQIFLISPDKNVNPEMRKHADFVRELRISHLAQAQLPNHIPFTSISKPELWNCRDFKTGNSSVS